MSLVYKRIEYFCKNKKKPILNQYRRIEIGKLVIQAYRSAYPETPLVHVINKEPDGIFRVIKYPTSFIKTIDAIISNYCDDMILNMPKKRKRIPIYKQKEKANM